jgi:dienelactone hydrolase
MGGFCVGASYALMAASQPEINDDVAFVNAFGPYFSMTELVQSIASKTKRSNGQLLPWEPDRLTREVFITHITADLPDNEGAALRSAFQQNPPQAIDPNSLSPQGQAAYTLLNSPHYFEADGAISRLPEQTLDNMFQVSPESYLDDLKARVLIMHDREDDLVPAHESQRLYDALQANGTDVTYTEYGIFRHVTPDFAGGFDALAELWRFSRHMHSIMMQAT